LASSSSKSRTPSIAGRGTRGKELPGVVFKLGGGYHTLLYRLTRGLIGHRVGKIKDPAWYRNLVANPDVAVQVGSKHMNVRARTADAREKPRLWRIMTKQWPGYDGYQKNTDRDIPLVVLEPR
jgi:deazaflavin-dependent oxidoreductase (nitroreductase family)